MKYMEINPLTNQTFVLLKPSLQPRHHVHVLNPLYNMCTTCVYHVHVPDTRVRLTDARGVHLDTLIKFDSSDIKLETNLGSGTGKITQLDGALVTYGSVNVHMMI